MLAEPGPIVAQPHTLAAAPDGMTEASLPPCEAQHASHPDIPPTRLYSPSGDSCSSHTAVGSDGTGSPSPSHVGLDVPVTAVIDPEVASITGDATTPQGTTAPLGDVQFLSICPPSWFSEKRYAERHYLSAEPNMEEILVIPPKNKFPPRPSTIGRGWTPFVHPEGHVYFRYERYYTNQYLYDEDSLRDMESAMDFMNEQLKEHDDLPQDFDIGLDVSKDNDGDKLACYYIADTTREEVFWLSECSIDMLVEQRNLPIPQKDPGHLRYAQMAAYWTHVLMFPHERQFPAERITELCAMLNFYSIDRLTSSTSCSPWSEDDMHRYNQTLKEIRAEVVQGCNLSAWEMFPIARLYSMLGIDLLQNYHGSKWARIDSNRSAHVDVTSKAFEPSWIFTVISWLLFCTPVLYLQRLDEIWIDLNVNHRPWRRFIAEIQEDWAASITPSTVILTANVGFLAIQSVDQGGLPATERSAGQIVCYISTLFSIGNIIACTVLSRQHRPTSYLHSNEAMNYLIKRAQKRWQTQHLAIILSIPTVFFIWALLSFSAAILWLGFNATSIVTRLCVFATAAFTTGLLCLVIMNGDWAPSLIVSSLPGTMKRKLQKVPGVRRLREQTRRFSEWSVKVFAPSGTSRTSSDSRDPKHQSPIRSLSSKFRKPSLPFRNFTYGFPRTSEPEEMTGPEKIV